MDLTCEAESVFVCDCEYPATDGKKRCYQDNSSSPTWFEKFLWRFLLSSQYGSGVFLNHIWSL